MIEREFYRLHDLAERWGCSVHDLLHLGIQDLTQICVNVYGMGSGSSRARMQTEIEEGDADFGPQTGEEENEAELHDAKFERWKARTTRDMPHAVYELGHDALRFIEMPDGLPFEMSEALKFDNGWWEAEFDPPIKIGLDHLCMLREEVVRLDRDIFRVGTSSAKRDRDPALSTVERDSLLKLVLTMAMAGYKYKPSAARNKATTEIADDSEKLGMGVTDDTVRKWLTVAATTLLEEKQRKA